MKTMVSLWTLALVAMLAAQTVVGFEMFDVLRASRQLKDSRRDAMSPADVIVHEVLAEIDTNNDGQITLAEAETYTGVWVSVAMGRHPYAEEFKGYLMAVAVIIDDDQSGSIELNELHRAATTLVTRAGMVQVGRVISSLVNIGRRSGSLDPVVKAGEMAGDFLAALDTDNDGLVSTAERDTLLAARKFRWGRERLEENMQSADQNGDGYLDQSETTQFLRTRAAMSYFNKFYIYTRLWKLGGEEVATSWLNAYY